MKNLIWVIPWLFSFYFIIALYGEKNINKRNELIIANQIVTIDSLNTKLTKVREKYNTLTETYCNYQEEKNKVNLFWNTISHIESSGGKYTLGDGGKAKGSFQIWDIAIQDVNQTFDTNFTHNQMFNDSIAKKFGMLYLNKGCKLYLKKYGKLPDERTLVNMWNFGIYQKQWNNGYYNKYLVAKELQNGDIWDV